MAETLLVIVAERVLSKSFSLASERISGAWGAKEDLQSLAEQLEMIQALLFDAENKSTTSRTVELWLKKLEAAATDADYLLDEFAYEVLRKKIEERKLQDKVHNFFSLSNSLAFRFKMAYKIKKINLRITGIFQESVQLGLVSRSNEIINSSIDIRRDRITDPFVDDSEIVGRNDDVEKVVSALTSSEYRENDLSVIGIVGMAGQGKTTVAQLVYRKEEVTRCFGKKIWICVSDDFNVERILNDMLQSLTGTVSMLTMREAIVGKLKEQLKGKRFLLVLDDVWNEDTECWSCMKKCLQEIGGSKGSKIIVTTRGERVVSIMRAFLIHRLGALSDGDSWKLFEKIAFVDSEVVKTTELVNIGEKIVKRCRGLPLAIKALGGLMYSKKDASEWSKIAESDVWGSFDGPTKVLSIIKLSYDHLASSSLKQCFEYCAVFQKDSIIERKPLIHQWMAHGLLNPSQGSKLEMEDVGNNYFQILLQRTLFQDADFDEFGNIKSCKMHDVVHDFALKASKDRCLTNEGELQSEDIKAVHLSIIVNRSESLDTPPKNLFRLRTLFLYGNVFPNDLLVKCKYLCVFVVHGSNVQELPNSIDRLKHLKYLDIYGTNIGKLPKSITKLYNLQTLRLRILLELQRDFGNLVKLRHFYFDDISDTIFLPGISKLTSLRTLPYFVVSGDRRCQIEELGYLQNLEGSLTIYGLENVNNHEEAMKADLSSKRNIENLELHWGYNIRQECNYEDVLQGLKPHSNLKGLKIVNFAGENLPSWMLGSSHQLFPHNLVTITLEKLIRCQQIPSIGHLPCLKVVNINEMESVKCIGNEFYGWTNQSAPTSSFVAFPSLKVLSLDGMSNLEQWSDPTMALAHESFHEVFPVLEILRVGGAPKLICLPDFLNTISTLKELRIYGCDNLRHVPEACAKLEELLIGFCSSIRLEDLCRPSNLRKLKLYLPKDVDYEDFPWPRKWSSVPALQYLFLQGTSKMKSLPKQIQHLPALRVLVVEEFQGLEALPEWLCNIPSLQSLQVSWCKNLAYLPSREALERLTTSCELRFCNCPILKERCKERSGPEWDKIAHLTNIYWFGVIYPRPRIDAINRKREVIYTPGLESFVLLPPNIA